MFHCDRCGCCCRSVLLYPESAELDRGDGVCKYFDEETALCSIYENRPLICNVDALYEHLFFGIMPKEEYYEINYKACVKLKEQFFNKH